MARRLREPRSYGTLAAWPGLAVSALVAVGCGASENSGAPLANAAGAAGSAGSSAIGSGGSAGAVNGSGGTASAAAGAAGAISVGGAGGPLVPVAPNGGVASCTLPASTKPLFSDQ